MNHYPFQAYSPKANTYLCDGDFVHPWFMIPEIIEAYRSRSSISKTYLNKLRDNKNISVNFNFHDSKGEFICYLGGHDHFTTNFDIHDISRSCRTYNVAGYRLIVPVDAQKMLTERIIGYWQEGTGGQFNKDREDAFSITRVMNSIEDTIAEIEEREGQRPVIITTSARIFPNTVGYKELSDKIFEDDRPYLLLFGTGWGLTDEVMDMSDYILEPIRGNTQYNHLSVRAAVAIILDRLLGEK